MLKLEVVDVEGHIYKLENSRGNVYKIILSFLDITEAPKKGDYIYMSTQLLNPRYEGYSLNYTFGDLKNGLGRHIESIDDIDVIVIDNGKEKLFLKRLYG